MQYSNHLDNIQQLVSLEPNYVYAPIKYICIHCPQLIRANYVTQDGKVYNIIVKCVNKTQPN